MKELLIIYYHEVVEKGQGLSYQKIEKEKFAEQMRYLAENGYQSLFFSELEKELPEKAIIISFDDGFRTVYENAEPIMRQYGLKGNIYLATGCVGTDPKFMSWEMVEELYCNRRFEMQAHTHNHVDIRTLSREGMQEEITRSNRLFEEHLGYTPKAFCMPYGIYTRLSIALLQECGSYRYVLGSFYGRRPENKLEDRILPRIGISDNDSLTVFVGKLNGKYDWKGTLQRVRLIAKNLKKERIAK